MKTALQILPPFQKKRKSLREKCLLEFADEAKVNRTLRAWPAAHECSDDIIQDLIQSGELVSFLPGDRIIKNGEMSDEAYILLHGTAEVQLANKNERRLRKAPISVGEMAFRSPGTGRCANVVAQDLIAALKVEGEDFDRIVRSCPSLSHGLQNDIDNRMRESARSLPKNRPNFAYYSLSVLAGFAVFLALYIEGQFSLGMCGLLGAAVTLIGLVLNPDHWLKRVFAFTLIGHLAINAITIYSDIQTGTLDVSVSSDVLNGWDLGTTVILALGLIIAYLMERRK